MCGITPNELCQWSEALPGQFGFTKQLVFRIALPHITLLLISVCYAFFGCVILSIFDYNGFADPDSKSDILAKQLQSTKRVYTSDLINGLLSLNLTDEPFNDFVTNLNRIYAQQQYLDERPPNLMWNLFYSTTWLASIGYGENAPRTTARRVFCMLYLTFGIPLYLVTLADLAKFCTEGINRLYTECVKLHYHVRFWYRRRNAVSAASGRLGDTFRVPHARDPHNLLVRKIERRTRQRWLRKSSTLIYNNEEEMAEFLWKHLEKTHFVEVPFALVYILLVGYLIFAAYFVAYLEKLTLWEAFYFIMMSVLTIGFGDIVPKNSNFILPILLVILIGLIVATTFIDMVGAYYIDRLHFFGRRMKMDDPLEWLKAVQQRRIEAMKREAMRRLFETATAMWHFHVVPPPPPLPPARPPPAASKGEVLPPPRGIVAFHVTADSVTLKWEPPLQMLLDGRKFWYTLSWKPRTPQRLCAIKVMDFIRHNRHEVRGLRSFTLYEFSVQISTSTGISRPARCQEYTEPCTVPQLLQLDAISSETATICWNSPRKNLGPEQYFLLFTQEPAPQFRYWRRYEVGKHKRFTLVELSPDTRYVVCVFAAHNFGFAAMSRSLRFKTRSWWYEQPVEPEEPAEKSHLLAPPSLSKWILQKARRPSLREPSIAGGEPAAATAGARICSKTTGDGAEGTAVQLGAELSSLQSGEYQDRS